MPFHQLYPHPVVNPFRPSDAIWRHISGSTLAQVRACCLTAPSHYLNQFRKRYLNPHSLKLAWKSKIKLKSSRGQCVNSLRPGDAYMCQWSNQHWFRWWLVAWSAPSHYQSQCWHIVKKTLRNKLQWIFSRNSNNFIQQNAFESVVCEQAAILSWPQWVNGPCYWLTSLVEGPTQWAVKWYTSSFRETTLKGYRCFSRCRWNQDNKGL